jgi:hypothetical protein
MLQGMTDVRIVEIDSALHANLNTLKEGFFDLLAALILLVVASLSIVHAVLRMAFAFLGLLLWAVALLIMGLYALRAWAVAQSSSSLHKE